MSLYVHEYGAKDAPLLVLLHGGGWSGWMWDKHVELFQGYRCLVPDLPEHGRSGNDQDFSMNAAAKEIIALIQERAGDQKAYVAAFSLGAQVALKMLAIAPETIKSAVLAGTLARRMPRYKLIAKVTQAALFLTRNWVCQKILASIQNIRDRDFQWYFADAKRFKGASLRRVLAANLTQGLPAGLKHVNVPVLVLVGQKESGIMLNSAKDLLKSIPNAQGCLIKNARHTFCYEDPEHFCTVARHWFSHNNLPPELIGPICLPLQKE